MKKSTLALMMMGFVASTATQAAEVYNKNANKLDVYGKIKAMHYFSDYDSKDGDQPSDRASQPVHHDLQHVLQGVEVLREGGLSENRREGQRQQKGVQSQARQARAKKIGEHVDHSEVRVALVSRRTLATWPSVSA